MLFTRPYEPFGILWGGLVIFSKILVDNIRHENLRFSVTSFHHYFRNLRFCWSCFFFLIMHSSQFCAENMRNYPPNIKGRGNSERENWGEKRQGLIYITWNPKKTKGWYTVDWLWKAGFFTCICTVEKVYLKNEGQCKFLWKWWLLPLHL